LAQAHRAWSAGRAQTSFSAEADAAAGFAGEALSRLPDIDASPFELLVDVEAGCGAA